MKSLRPEHPLMPPTRAIRLPPTPPSIPPLPDRCPTHAIAPTRPIRPITNPSFSPTGSVVTPVTLTPPSPLRPGPQWWEAVNPPEGLVGGLKGVVCAKATELRETLRQLLTQSWMLLAAALAPLAPEGCPLFDQPSHYAIIVGSFERRNCSVQVGPPTRERWMRSGRDLGEITMRSR